jgi:signal transduction histidine kinase
VIPTPPMPEREAERLATLATFDVLDTPPEESFDRVAKVAGIVCQTPMAMVTLLDRERLCIKAKVNVDAREVAREITFCAHTVAAGDTLVVDDASQDSRFSAFPIVLSAPQVRFYAAAPIRVDGHCLGTVCVMDLVPRHLSREQRAALEALSGEVASMLEARRARRELEQVREQKEQLTSMAVHDLRGPLAVVTVSAQALLAEPDVSDSIRETANGILAAAGRINRMASNLLSVSQSESGELVPVLESIDLATLFDRIGDGILKVGSAFDHPIELDLAGATGEAFIDPELIRRIVVNLVDNAFKYAPPGTPVRLEVETRARVLWLRVRDQGSGVPPDERLRIFDPYVRLDPTRVATRAGFGLGLAFCRTAATALGGRIWVEDNDGPGGSVFHVELPLRPRA